MKYDGLPITTPARTLWDLAGTSSRGLEKAFALALDRGLLRRSALERVLRRHEGASGSRAVRRLLEADPALTRSPAEDRLQELIRAAGLPEPKTNVMVEGLEVDCYWPDEGVVVEVDGFAYHGSAAAFERDRSRDRRLVASGRVVIRVTWQQMDQTPLRVIAELAQALARA
jgi:very-short-patch-repair endonuclease